MMTIRALLFTLLVGFATTFGEPAHAQAPAPVDHAATAAQLREQASEARAAAAHHRRLVRLGHGKQNTGVPSLRHKRLAKQFTAKAAELEKAASEHDAAAERAD